MASDPNTHARGRERIPATVRRVAAGAVVLAAVLSACSTGSLSGSSQPGVKTPDVSTPPGAPASADKRMSINSASEKDIAAALKSTGVDAPEKWAQDIARAKPYPAEDPEQRKLREVLIRSGSDPETIEKALTSLKP